MIRLFAAVEVPAEIGEGLARRQQGLPGARWSPPENLHVTLRYFGEDAVYDAREGGAGPRVPGLHQSLKTGDPFRHESFLKLAG